jgi:cell division protein FtsL
VVEVTEGGEEGTLLDLCLLEVLLLERLLVKSSLGLVLFVGVLLHRLEYVYQTHAT